MDQVLVRGRLTSRECLPNWEKAKLIVSTDKLVIKYDDQRRRPPTAVYKRSEVRSLEQGNHIETICLRTGYQLQLKSNNFNLHTSLWHFFDSRVGAPRAAVQRGLPSAAPAQQQQQQQQQHGLPLLAVDGAALANIDAAGVNPASVPSPQPPMTPVSHQHAPLPTPSPPTAAAAATVETGVVDTTGGAASVDIVPSAVIDVPAQFLPAASLQSHEPLQLMEHGTQTDDVLPASASTSSSAAAAAAEGLCAASEKAAPCFQLYPECSVCMNADAIFAPANCGHLCMCDSCSIAICSAMTSRCPICRSYCYHRIRIYL